MTVDAWVIGCADTCRSCLQQIPLAQWHMVPSGDHNQKTDLRSLSLEGQKLVEQSCF